LRCGSAAFHEEIAEDIGAERALDFFGFDLQRIRDLVLLGRVVDQDVKTPECLHRALHRLGAELVVSDVSGELDPA
jgi:hypothetical protein